MSKFVSDGTRAAIDSHVFALQESLLYGAIQQQQLETCRAWFAPRHAQDVVEERATAGLCGWPACETALPKYDAHGSKFHISLRNKQIVERGAPPQFCSAQCQSAAESWIRSLSVMSIYSRPQALRHAASVAAARKQPTAPAALSATPDARSFKRARRKDAGALPPRGTTGTSALTDEPLPQTPKGSVHNSLEEVNAVSAKLADVTLQDATDAVAVASNDAREMPVDSSSRSLVPLKQKAKKSKAKPQAGFSADSIVSRTIVERTPDAAKPLPAVAPADSSAVEGHKSAPAVWEAHLSFSVAPKSAGNSTDTATAAALAMAESLDDDLQDDDGSSNPTQGPGGDDGGETDGESADSCDADGEGATAAERQQADIEHDAALWREIMGADMPPEVQQEGEAGPWLNLEAMSDKTLREELAASFKPFITLWNALAQWVTPDTQQCLAQLRGEATTLSTKKLETSQALVKSTAAAVASSSQQSQQRTGHHMGAATLTARQNAVSLEVSKHSADLLKGGTGTFETAWHTQQAAKPQRCKSDKTARQALALLVGSFDYTCSMPKLTKQQWSLMPLILATALLSSSSSTGHDTCAAADAAIQTFEESALRLGVTRDEFRLLCGVFEKDSCQVRMD